MENSLKFLKTLTVEGFKKLQGCTSLQVRRNPATSKLFMTWANESGEQFTGAVSSKGIPQKPMVSLVEGEEGQFFLLHAEVEGAPIEHTF